MAAPKYDIIQTNYKNPDASSDLKLNIVVVSNTPEEKLIKNIKENSQLNVPWLDYKEPNDKEIVLVGGGWSINDCIDEIRELANHSTVVSMNGSAKWLRENGIKPDWQVIVDAKEETSEFVDPECESYFASQCNTKTIEKAKNLTLVHFGLETIEEHLPEERVKKGGYVLLGCGTTVGNAALSIAYSQGFRKIHIFGYDSSYHEDNSHGFSQPMNNNMPTVNVTWSGKTFKASVAMKGQAEKFPLNALSLKNAGCELHVYGEGLLQTIYRADYSDLTEQEKYQLMWNVPGYRHVSPGEHVVETFLEVAKPEGLIIDYGCGTGRAGLKLSETHDVILVDFADNCRDQEALKLPFIQNDLSKPIEVKGDYGICTDVMEHIPTEDVEKVIDNIMNSSKKVFFQISTIDDMFGTLIGTHLHLTVKPFSWWRQLFLDKGYAINWSQEVDSAALFYIINPRRN